MVRIKGVNSDYTYVGVPETAPIKEDLNSDPLYLELFLCPNNQPSRVEPHEGDRYCNGTDAGCPDPTHPGHVKVRLDQAEGVVLSAKDVDALKVSETAVTSAVPLHVVDALQVSTSEVKATVPLNASQPLTVTVASPSNPPVIFKVSSDGVVMQAPGGAGVTINSSGITLAPGDAGVIALTGDTTISGKITVTGNVSVIGDVSITGNSKITGSLDLSEAEITFSRATINNIQDRINSGQ